MSREVEEALIVSCFVEQDELVLVVATDDTLAGANIHPSDVPDRLFMMREKGSATRRIIEEG